MAYQDFPWQKGDSLSIGKLAALALPDLAGKRVLDVGCNTGFFCGWAVFQSAARVKGIDKNRHLLRQARMYFPQAEFACMSWDEPDCEQFDVILCLSAIELAADPARLIANLMGRLAPDGVLVLEVETAPGDAEGFIAVNRDKATVHLPTLRTMNSLLSAYAAKHMGPWMGQKGEATVRHVYQVGHRKPYAVLLMDDAYSGKSACSRSLFRNDLLKISGDALYHEMLDGMRQTPDALVEYMRRDPSGTVDCSEITSRVCAAGQLAELGKLVLKLAGKRDFLVDHYIPQAFRKGWRLFFQAAGCFVVCIDLPRPERARWLTDRPGAQDIFSYYRHLEQQGLVDADAYLKANPDVARAVAEGRIPSAQYHYYHFGRRERRKLK